MSARFYQVGFWLTVVSCTLLFIGFSFISGLTVLSELHEQIELHQGSSNFFDSEILTNSLLVGLLHTFLGGLLSNPADVLFVEHNPLLKVNYAYGMAKLLAHQISLPFLTGAVLGGAINAFLVCGLITRRYHQITSKDDTNDESNDDSKH